MASYSATYSPDDNKLRIYASTRLDPETYARVKAAGYKWAPKQDLFVAPMWTPEREDVALELAGGIGDEDTSLVERAELRADRFDDYSGKRSQEAEQARKAVAEIADNIPLGQPILVGHHSERHARKDQARIENGMRRAVKLWDTATYWESRAKGAVMAAKYKELPSVRARRIKGLEADLRKEEKQHAEAVKLHHIWTNLEAKVGRKADGTEATFKEKALHIANYTEGYMSFCFPLAQYPRDLPASQYEGNMSIWSALNDSVITPEQARDILIPVYKGRLPRLERWIAHLNNRLAYERAMLADAGGIVATRTGPEKGGACRCWASHRGGWSYIQKVNRVSVSVLDNWGNGGGNFSRVIPMDKLNAVMTLAEVDQARKDGRLVEAEDKTGFFLREAPTPDDSDTTPAPEPTPEPMPAPEPSPAADTGATIEAMRASLKAGVRAVVAPLLFPTPKGLAIRVVEAAAIRPGMRVLEPSAGTGNLLVAIDEARGYVSDQESSCDIVAVEINCNLISTVPHRLYGRFLCADFLDCGASSLGGNFDRIVMNPPFANGADVTHVRHALDLLVPGGRLVAVMSNGITFKTDKATAALRDLIDQRGGTIERLPAGTFKDCGTMVETVLLTVTK